MAMTTAAKEIGAARLPAQYRAALDLADAMLAAAQNADWQTVAALRRRIPALAAALQHAWAALPPLDPATRKRLERERISAIRRVLAVDNRIRHLADPRESRLQKWLLGARADRRLN
ncbi:MAG: flagellar protein FliT [Lautropia sp.]